MLAPSPIGQLVDKTFSEKLHQTCNVSFSEVLYNFIYNDDNALFLTCM